MLSTHHSLYVQHQVGLTAKGRTAETSMDSVSVQPPYLVLPLQIRTHRGAGGRTRTRAGISIYVRQGKEVGQIKGWRGFQPSYLPSTSSIPWTELVKGQKQRFLPGLSPSLVIRAALPVGKGISINIKDMGSTHPISKPIARRNPGGENDHDQHQA